MAFPHLYVCYGMPKSGSTLAFQLSRAIAARGGFDQGPLPEMDEPSEGKLASDRFGKLLLAAQRSGRHMVVIKTHAGPTDALRDAVRDGRALVQVHARDPRDIALSMRDAGACGAEWGKTVSGAPIRNPEDALGRIRRSVLRHQQWAKLPGALCLNYEQTAFSSQHTARRIAEHMHVPPAKFRDVLTAKRQFTQLNKGRSQRFLAEMDQEQQDRWYAEFRDFIDACCPPPDGPVWKSRMGTLAGRMLRAFRI